MDALPASNANAKKIAKKAPTKKSELAKELLKSR
jgi:hypothetical protein